MRTDIKVSEKWKNNGHNYLFEIDGVTISYNPSIRQNIFDAILTSCCEIDDRQNKDETAIIMHREFLILNGNFTDEYEKCNNLTEVLNVYNKNVKKYGSCYSTDRPLKIKKSL